MSGGTYFAPFLKVLIQKLEMNVDKKQFEIAMILTDGIIEDSQEAKDLIYKLTDYPCSIIIVYVGTDSGGLNLMQDLASVNGPFKNSNGKPVPLRNV